MKKITIFLSFLSLSFTGLAQKVSFQDPPSEVTMRKVEVQTDTVWAVVDDTLQKVVMKQQGYAVVYHPTNKELEGVQFWDVPTFYIEDRKVKVDMYYKPTPIISLSSFNRLYNKTFLTQD